MAMTIGTNAASLTAARSLHESSKDMQTAMERLSTGNRINSASDDAAGSALSMRMQGHSAGLGMAVKNISNGVATVDAIEASLDEVSDILIRMREISTQAASDNFSSTDRQQLNDELVSLRNELDSISSRTEFGGQKILDGTYVGKQIQTGTNANDSVTLTQASTAASALGAFRMQGTDLAATASTDNTASTTALDTLRTGTMDFEIVYTDSAGTSQTTTSNFGDGATDSAKSMATEVNETTSTHGVHATAFTEAEATFTFTGDNSIVLELGSLESGDGGTLTAIASFNSVATGVAAINASASTTGITARANGTANVIILTDADGDNIVVRNTNAGTGNATSTVSIKNMSDGTAGAAAVADDQAAGSGADGKIDTVVVMGRISLFSDQAFSVKGEGAKSLIAPSATTAATAVNLDDASLTTQANAESAISIVAGALDRVASMKGDLGALSNRLGHTLDSAMVMRDMTDQAVATLKDTDYSQESAALARAQVQQQVGTAMLAQANAAPQLVLQLIQ